MNPKDEITVTMNLLEWDAIIKNISKRSGIWTGIWACKLIMKVYGLGWKEAHEMYKRMTDKEEKENN